MIKYAGCLIVVVAMVLTMRSSPLGAQSPTAAGPGTTVPRTADGRPDLQGVWSFATLTPMQRPEEHVGKAVLTDEEAAEFVQNVLQSRDKDQRREGVADVEDAYNQFWYDWGSGVIDTRRTSLVVDPPDGRIPALTEHGQTRRQTRSQRPDLPARHDDLPYIERCLLGFNSGPPMTPSAYNNNMQLFQTGDHVVILNEMVHDARVISLDGRSPLPATIRQWMGSSRGRWEGDTLVVETTNFLGETSFNPKGSRIVPGAAATMHLSERFTRVDGHTLFYEFTVDDPSTWTRSWTALVPMTFSEVPVFEYACHEGNYGLAGMLSGARANERAADEHQSR